MSVTPVEIRHVKPARRPFGYDRKAIDRLLAEIAASYEDVWRERADLRDEVERLEGELAMHKEVEAALRNSLVSAERIAEEIKTHARREGDVIIAEARARARDITGGAEAERERIDAEIRRLRAAQADMRAEYRAFLLAALDRIEGDTEERLKSPGQAA
jgi:cell division initiation protein